MIRSGKTTRLFKFFNSQSGIGGFLTPDVQEKRLMYDVEKKIYLDFEEETSSDQTISIGKFSFLKSSFDHATKRIIDQIENRNIHCILVDEIGKLELKNLGFASLLKTLLKANWENRDLLLVVRASLLTEVTSFFGISNYILLKPNELDSHFVRSKV